MASIRNKIAKSRAAREAVKAASADRRPVVLPRIKGGKPKPAPLSILGQWAKLLKDRGKL